MTLNVRRHVGRVNPRERLRIELRRARRPAVVVALAVAAAAASAATILANINVRLPWDDVRQVRIAVTSAKGIVPGKQEARWAGVVVGHMTKVDLVDGRPVVTVDYDGHYGPLYRDARVRLRPQTPLNDLFLDIESPGHRSAGRLGDGILRAERTRVPVDIGSVLQIFDEDVRGRMESAIDGFGRGVRDGGERLRATFAQVAPFLAAAQRLSREFALRRELTRRMVHDLRLMTDELAARDRRVTQLVSAGDATLGELAAKRGAVDAALRALPPTFDRLRRSSAQLERTLAHVDDAAVALRPAAAALPSGLGALRAFSRDALGPLRRLRAPVSSLGRLVADLRPTTASLATAFARLRVLAPRYDRITARILPCRDVVAKFFAWTMSVLKYADANGTYPRGNAVQSSSSYLSTQPDVVLRTHAGCTGARP